MKRERRLDIVIMAACLGLVLAPACDETPSGSARTVRLVQPLTMSWNGSSSGVPYDGGPAVFSATAALRVIWSFRIEAVSRPAGESHPRYVQEFSNQEHIQFLWDGHNNAGVVDFAPGDSCVATVHFANLDPADADNARVGFRIAR
jgi:hypothetical protein